MDDVMFSYNGENTDADHSRIIHRDSPGGAAKLRTWVEPAIFALWFLSFYLSIFFYSSPNLSGRRLDVYHTSTHGVALVRY